MNTTYKVQVFKSDDSLSYIYSCNDLCREGNYLILTHKRDQKYDIINLSQVWRVEIEREAE